MSKIGLNWLQDFDGVKNSGRRCPFLERTSFGSQGRRSGDPELRRLFYNDTIIEPIYEIIPETKVQTIKCGFKRK